MCVCVCSSALFRSKQIEPFSLLACFAWAFKMPLLLAWWLPLISYATQSQWYTFLSRQILRGIFYNPSSKVSGEKWEWRQVESVWIVATWLLYHLQYLTKDSSPQSFGIYSRGRTSPLIISRITIKEVESVVSSMNSNLEMFSHYPTHGGFGPLPFQPSAMTNYVNQRFLSY